MFEVHWFLFWFSAVGLPVSVVSPEGTHQNMKGSCTERQRLKRNEDTGLDDKRTTG